VAQPWMKYEYEGFAPSTSDWQARRGDLDL